MISKRIDREKKTSDFERLGRYVLEAKSEADAILWTRTAEYVADLNPDSTGEKVLWYRISNCASQVPAMAIAEVLSTQAENTRSRVDKTYHCVISFPEGEQPTREQLEDIEDEICRALGFEDHQRISAVHQDTDNIHMHLAINKVHPTTFKVLEPYRDYYIRDKACRMLEKKHGLTVDHGIGQGKRYGKAQQMEAHTGEETFLGWIQTHAAADLKTAIQEASDWQAVHAAFAVHGLMIKPRGAGLVVGTLDGSMHVKASSVDRELAFKVMTARFGEYQPLKQPQDRSQAVSEPMISYQVGPKMGDTAVRTLYAEFQRKKQAARQARQNFKASQQTERVVFNQSLKAWHQGERTRIQQSTGLPQEKRAAYGRLSQERQRALTQQREQEARRKTAFYPNNPVLTWEQYLVKQAESGNSVALSQLRKRKIRQEKVAKALLTADNLEAARHIVCDDLKPMVRKNGDIMYQVQDGGCVTDERTRVRVDRITAGSVFLALNLASERFAGQALDVRGTDTFRRQVVEISVQFGMAVTFKDPSLEAERVRFSRSGKEEALSPALEAFITQRNRLREKVSDILPHRVWTKADTGEVIYQGRRNLVDGTQAVLLQKGNEMLVKPVREQEFQGVKVGKSLTLNAQNKENHPSQGQGW